MLTLRPARWPDDLALLAALDTSFSTDRVYQVIRDGLGFQLVEETVNPPLHKEYGAVTDDDRLPEMECVVVAEQDGALVGMAAAEYESWNRRMCVRHLYVAVSHRGAGIGRALLERMETTARSAGARCLWLDTPNVNYPAIQFYQRMGFRLCGLDLSFYDPDGTAPNEIALFLARELDASGAHTSAPAAGRP